MRSWFRRLGPGLLYAGAAVGVSHLVQSTRAGASYGLLMVLVVVLANWLKYPFFKAGPLYAIHTGKSLLEAFFHKGRAAMLLFYTVTLTTMFAVQAVVTLILASVLSSIFDLKIELWQISAILLVACGLILLIGKFQFLADSMRWVILLLTLTTLISLIVAIVSPELPIRLHSNFSFSEVSDVFFLIALVGWMPAPLDIALWHSEWTLEDFKNTNSRKSPSAVRFDFNVGYWGTTFLAASFVALGAIVLQYSDAELSNSGSVFAGQLIGMYTRTLGSWTFTLVALAAFTTMFSTTLTVLDAYPRVLKKAATLHRPAWKTNNSLYSIFLIFTVAGALFVLIFQLENMKQLVDFATTISFLTAPVLASLIYLVCKPLKDKVLNKRDNFTAILGLIFLYAFSIYYLWVKYF